VQASPVFLDAAATTDKAVSLIREAAKNGAQIVAFPEVFIPGYPYWSWITDPVDRGSLVRELVRASILVRVRRSTRSVERRATPKPMWSSALTSAAPYRSEHSTTRWSSLVPTAHCWESIASSCQPGGKADVDRRRRFEPQGLRYRHRSPWEGWLAAKTPTRLPGLRCWLRVSLSISPVTFRCRSTARL